MHKWLVVSVYHAELPLECFKVAKKPLTLCLGHQGKSDLIPVYGLAMKLPEGNTATLASRKITQYFYLLRSAVTINMLLHCWIVSNQAPTS